MIGTCMELGDRDWKVDRGTGVDYLNNLFLDNIRVNTEKCSTFNLIRLQI